MEESEFLVVQEYAVFLVWTGLLHQQTGSNKVFLRVHAGQGKVREIIFLKVWEKPVNLKKVREF